MKARAIDAWVIGYACVTSIVPFVWARDQLTFLRSHELHLAAVGLVLVVALTVPVRGRIWPFVRFGYPLLLFGPFYADSANYIFVVVSHWMDPALMEFERALFGFNPAVQLAQIDSRWLLDFWMVGYFSYYLLFPAAVAVCIWRREAELFRRMMVATCGAFFVSYTLFYLFPLEGPRHALAGTLPPLKGVLFYPLVMKIQRAGAIHGGCMPSSHTAVAWIIAFYVLRVHRPTGRVMAALSVLLAVGCVWGRFHYVSDVAVGLVIFFVAVWLTERYHRKAGTGQERTSQDLAMERTG